MLLRWQWWVTIGVAVLTALMAGYTMMLFSQNRAAQGEFASRAQYVQQSIQLEALYRDLVKALADLSVRDHDKALADLLSSQGISVNASGTASPSAAASPASPPPPVRNGAKR